MSEENVKGKFYVTKVTPFADLTPATLLPESDLCFQDDKNIYQFKYERPDKEEKYQIKPGVYMTEQAGGGIKLSKIELQRRKLLASIANTESIINEANKFFNRLHVYDKWPEEPKKRSILLYSAPGLGKSSSIALFCNQFVEADPGTVIINWPTSSIDPEYMSRFFSAHSEYDPACKKLILIMEDIGGGERETGGPRDGVSSGLLNFLDGVDVTFRLPTFIIATTNYPENLLENLADRPGRFDLMLELKSPPFKEKIELLEFIAQRPLTDEEKTALEHKEAETLSIAHLREIIVRSELDEKTIPQVVDEILEHRRRMRRSFQKPKGQFGITQDPEDVWK